MLTIHSTIQCNTFHCLSCIHCLVKRMGGSLGYWTIDQPVAIRIIVHFPALEDNSQWMEGGNNRQELFQTHVENKKPQQINNRQQQMCFLISIRKHKRYYKGYHVKNTSKTKAGCHDPVLYIAHEVKSSSKDYPHAYSQKKYGDD